MQRTEECVLHRDVWVHVRLRGAEKRERCTVLAVRIDIHKKLTCRLEKVGKHRADGSCWVNGRRVGITSIYAAPQGSRHCGDEIITGAETW